VQEQSGVELGQEEGQKQIGVQKKLTLFTTMHEYTLARTSLVVGVMHPELFSFSPFCDSFLQEQHGCDGGADLS